MTDQVLEETPAEVTEEQAEADFAKGFGPAEEQSEAAPTTETKDAPKAEEKAEAPAPEEKKADAPADKGTLIAGLTEDEWNARINKVLGPVAKKLEDENRKNFSQYGELKRTLEELRTAGGKSTARPKITAELLKRVNAELPGLGDALAEDLSAILGGAEAAQEKAEAKGQSFDPEAYFTQKIVPALEKSEARNNQRAELRIVKSIHRDFDTVVKSPEFKAWLEALPADRQKEVRESEDGFVAADAVTEFKTAREKAQKQKSTNKQRIEAAVTPKGVPSAGPQSPNTEDDEAAFQRGFSGKRAA